jgi:hypothetical protein
MIKGHRCGIGLLSVIMGGLLLMPPALCAQQPTYGGTLRVAWGADITGLDPYICPLPRRPVLVCGGQSLQQPAHHRWRAELCPRAR